MYSFLILLILSSTIQSSLSFLTANIPEDGRLNFTGLAKKYGQEKTTEHDVTTSDGYILRMFHVPGNSSRPVLLIHGILGSSDDFLVRGYLSLVYYLASAGYDLWLGNVRGNRYSRRHVSLNPDTDAAFWNYGVDEYSLKDLPAMIDHVLEQTGQSNLAAIGYSEGTIMFYALAADKPEYNDKVKIMISLAPVCYLNYVKQPLKGIAKLGGAANTGLKLLKQNEVQGYNSTAKKVEDVICTQGNIGYYICLGGVFLVAGSDFQQIERDFHRVIQGHMPAGTSRKNLYHLAQMVNSGRFAKYDYGKKNQYYYKSSVSPQYNVTNVSMKVALLVGSNDGVATVQGAKKIRDNFPNVVLYKVLDYPKWSHLDFIFAREQNKYMFPTISELLTKYAL